MKNTQGRHSVLNRALAFLLAVVMVAGYFPTNIWKVSATEANGITTVADPQTLTRPETIYGDNTLNAGKVTVGKSVSTSSVTVNGKNVPLSNPDNFLVTMTQTAQVMGLSSETSVPVDVVFVLDTSGSMEGDRTKSMVNAANSAIKSLMEANKDNRVSVVAFSSAAAWWDGEWTDWGQGTSNGAAANVLSPLAHYDDNTNTATTADDAASNHLRWANSSGTASTNGAYLLGRGSGNISAGYRRGNHEDAGGTNIHAGIALGAQQLMKVTDTTVTYEGGTTINRMPFIVVLSDGAPTFASSSTNWYEPSQTAQNGDGNNAYTGNGFLAALTAAYYKGAITDHYYGSAADNSNRCYVYTIGVSVGNNTLANLTLNPKENFNANATGNNHGGRFTSYWNSYNRNNLTNGFTVEVNDDQNFRITNTTISATKNFITGKNTSGTVMYTEGTGITYNDGFYSATQTNEIAGIFDDIVAEISKKAISVPTKVDNYGADFSGYVTFTDPIGEYMEIKEMKGIIADGNFYKGSTAAQYLASGANEKFNTMIRQVLTTRLSMTESTEVSVNDLLSTADGNSITWWGSTYNVGEEDTGMQVVGAAADDSIEYITASTTQIPEEADYVCRSYFYYGTAGSTVEKPNHEYLYFVVRVQRALKAPYQQTVVISMPASLLSMEKVLITESKDDDGNAVYTASVQEAEPARVVYEVGLRSDITAENVDQIVSASYKGETVNGTGSVNYDAATGTYHFFTNDWDRTQDGSEHHRAMAKATFDAAMDNAFYTYQTDTLIVDANGNAVTSNPKGKTAYYVREYYDWSNVNANADGEFAATPKTQLIKIEVPSDATLVEKDGKWYIPKDSHTASTLETIGDDIEKTSNTTGTALIVSHAHRTGNQYNSHYTVLLGNNGKLSLKSNPPVPEKTVHVNGSVTDDNGKEVKVDDELTYEITVENTLNKQEEFTITDQVPAGTVFVSADNGGTQADGTVTWKLSIPANSTKTVKMTVRVTKDALNTNVVPSTIKNTAVVTFPNNAKYTTNSVENPPYGKTAADQSGKDTADQPGYQVGDEITFHIRFHNNATNSDGAYVDANVTIVDKIPAGTELVEGTITNNGTVDADGTITWNLTNVKANMAGVVSFRVRILASAGDTVTNYSTITVGNNPTITTNTTETKVAKGDLVLTKTVAAGDEQTKEFTLTLTESTGMLNGTFSGVAFADGYAEVTIKHGQTVTIQDLPAGVKITVAELAPDGWTATYDGAATAQEVTITADAAATATVNVNNDYHAKPVTFQLKGKKTFVGETFPTGVTFTFRAVQCDANGTVLSDPITVTAKTTSPNGEILFSAREFTTAFGERYYKITEDGTTVPGLITDNSAYLLYLKVVDDGKGNLQLTHKLSKDGKEISSGENQTGTVTVEGADFTNTYPEPTSITLGGDKTLSGRYQVPGEFGFQLLVPGNNSVDSGSAVVRDTTSNVVNADNGYNGSFSFDPITYTAEDMVNEDGTIAMEKTFYYYIREIPGQNADITYDPAHYVVTVTVKNLDGKLEASKSIVKYEEAGADTAIAVNKVSFGNTFKVQDTRVILTGTKVLTGRTMREGEFSFSVYRADASGSYQKTKENQVSSGVSTAAGKINFSPIGFQVLDMLDQDGNILASKDFYFAVIENHPIPGSATSDPNMYYDPAEYLVKVTVTYDASEGTLTAGTPVVVAGGQTIAFSNIQNPSTITVKPIAVKKITGSSLPDGLSFSFKVVPVSGGTDAATGTSTPITGSYVAGSAIDAGFTSMVYSYELWNEKKDADGVATFTYWILESNTGSAGNGVDYTTVRYLYEVKVTRTATNALVTTETYYKQNDGVADGNTDAANYTTVIATYTSTQGKDAYNEFVNTVKAAVVFTNNYYAETQINLTAKKQMNGMELEGKDFDFLLQRLDSTGAIIPDSKTTGSNDQKGNITFATLNYSSAMLTDAYKAEDGCYYFSYLLNEIKPADVAIKGVDYDETKYIVTVKITQTAGAEGAAGTLTAELAGVSYATESNGKYTPGEKVENFTAAGNTNITFENTYSVKQGTEVVIEATKTLTGRDFVMNDGVGEFGFALYRQDRENSEIWHNIGTAFNDADGKVSFTRYFNANTLTHMTDAFQDIDNDGKEEYVAIYRINEINGGLGGVTYSGAVYYVKAIIEHDMDNAKYVCQSITYYTDAACETVAEKVEFVNTYKTNDTGFTPVASKELLGAGGNAVDLSNYSFSFEVVEIKEDGTVKTHDNGAAVVTATGRSDATGKVTFSDVIYNGLQEVKCENKTNGASGDHTHYYMIRESQGTAQGITYSKQNYYIKVTVNDNGKGTLSVKDVTYYKDLFNTAIDANQVVFTNHHGSGSTELNLTVNKVVQVQYPMRPQTFALRGTPVIDPGAEYELTGSEFDFEVYKANANFEITDPTAVASGTNGAGSGEATVPFTTITYTRKDAYENGNVVSGQASSQTYYYVIKELVPSEGSIPGVSIDTKEIHATVTVTDDGYGNMTAAAVYANGDQTFTNTYQVKDPVSVTLTAVKELIGKDMETFTFQLKDADGNVLNEKQNDGSTVTFDALTFYLPGTYTYTVTEVKGTNEHMTYDETEYTVIIEVWDDRKGELYTVVTVRNGSDAVELMKFTNTYKHPELTVDLSTQINANKTVAGPEDESLEYLLKKYEFRFEVIDLEGNPVLDADGNPMVGVTDENGNITFPEFVFEMAGVYHYLIREQAAYEDRRITTDDQIWCAHIQVIYDSAEGVLKIMPDGCTTHLYNPAVHNAEGGMENPVFINRYDPKDISVQVNGKKILEGRPLLNHEFTFRLLDEKGNIAAEAKNHSDGSITFYLDYALEDLVDSDGKQVPEKVFTYQMVEVIPDSKLGGVRYTEKRVAVQVTVTDNQEGQLTATVEYAEKAQFVNTYDAADGTAVIEALKVLEGISLSGKVFQFQLLDEDSNPVLDAEGNPIVAANDADGKIRFEIPMTEAGTYKYQIAEIKGNIPGVTYDENTYQATVTVTDNLAGQLICVTTYENNAVPTFVNVYEADGAVALIEATKKYTGNKLAGEDFEFQLLDAQNNVVATAKNDADGNIFLSCTFEEAGEYVFTLVEKAGSDDHITYDDRIVTVTVTVTDNGEGKLIASAPVYDTADGKAPVFKNTYTPDPIQVTVEASKQYTGGKALKDNDFTFQLLDSENKVVASAKNTADGKISFLLDIEAEGTYTYTMVEKAGTDAQITYDANQYTVTVKVTNVDGVLTAAVTYGTEEGEAPVFQNTWKLEKIGITLTGTKTLTGRDMKAGEFKFQVHDSTGTLVATGTNDAKGNINFTPVGIVTKGTYLLTISEVAGSAEYVTYDKTTFQVKVVVENVDGKLVPKITYPDGEIAFENSYDEPDNPETGDNSPIYWMVGLLAISALAMVLLIVLRPKKSGKYTK